MVSRMNIKVHEIEFVSLLLRGTFFPPFFYILAYSLVYGESDYAVHTHTKKKDKMATAWKSRVQTMRRWKSKKKKKGLLMLLFHAS